MKSVTEQQFLQMMQGQMPEQEIATLLKKLAERGETADEITAAADVLKSLALKPNISIPDKAMDTCGTGGDGAQTFNISTTVAIVLAACGVPVAKHGNRAASSKSGSADMLEALGVNINATPQQVERCIQACNIGFLFAPSYHQAMRHVAPVRKALGIRTIFNLVGPLANPLNVKRQLLGVYDKKWLQPMAKALKNMGSEKAIIVYGGGGLDEFSLDGEQYYCGLDGEIKVIRPQDIGLTPAPIEALKGGTPQENAKITKQILSGECQDAKRDVVLFNAAAGLMVADKVKNWERALP